VATLGVWNGARCKPYDDPGQGQAKIEEDKHGVRAYKQPLRPGACLSGDDSQGMGAVITRALSYLCPRLACRPRVDSRFTIACLSGGGKGREIVRKAVTIKRAWLPRM